MNNDYGFGIYVHWPFCLHKCPYCDFNSHVRQNIDVGEWCKAYRKAIQHWREFRNGEKLDSIYFGGGTPSTAPVEVISTILNEIGKYWDLDGAEITLEANPTSSDTEKFAGYFGAGVNRLSLGFQALDDVSLKQLGRMHSVKESMQALEIAKKYFSRVNVDLIYARQFQTVNELQNELNQLVMLDTSHISLYQLTIEDGTRFQELYKAGRLPGLLDDIISREMYIIARDHMREAGFRHYEVSNFAKPGQESQHNLIYWRGGDYIGIGPGAHGRISDGMRKATTQASSPEEWVCRPEIYQVDALSNLEIAEEYIMMGLRVGEGIKFERLDNLNFNFKPNVLFDLLDLGLISQDNSGIQATDEGRLVLNYVIKRLLTE